MDERLAEIIQAGGVEGFVRNLRRKWKYSAWLLDECGKCLHGDRQRLSEAFLVKAYGRTEDVFFEAGEKVMACRAETEGHILLLLIAPMPSHEAALWQKQMEEYRRQLLACLRLTLIQQKRRWQHEQEIIEVLFGRREGIEQFLEASSLRLVEDYPYAVHLLFARKPQPRAKFDEVASLLEEYSRVKGINSLRPIFWRDHLVHIIPALHERSSFSELFVEWPARQLGEDFRHLAEESCQIELAIGIGSLHPMKYLYRSYDEAYLAIRSRWQEQAGGFVERYEDLGYFTFLLSAPREQQEAYINRWLGPVLEYDRARQAKLLPTLDYLLRHAFDWQVTARHFGVKVSTLHYRIKRIEELLDVAIIRDGRTKFELYTALKLREMLQEGWGKEYGLVGRWE